MKTIHATISIMVALVLAPRVQALPISTATTYQGSLLESGTPIDEPADMRFSLWTAAAAGSQIGATIEFSNATIGPVNVVGGLFTVDLDFGSVPFNGQEVYLEIAARVPAGAGGWTTLSPRQRMAATPYSLFSTLPWQTNGNEIFYDGTFVGIGHDNPSFRLDVRTTSGRAIFGWSTATSGNNFGMYGQSESTGGTGVFGFATADTGSTNGVMGFADSATGRGVYGFALDAQGANYGVYGETNSDSGWAGYFVGRGRFSEDLGIGVSPAARLHVLSVPTDNRPTMILQTQVDQGGGLLDVTSLEFDGGSIDAFSAVAGPTSIRLNPNTGGDILLGLGGGEVGVNTVAPSAKLHVVGSSNASASSGGIAVIEHGPSGNQLAFDGNELQARSGGSASALRLNAGGGNVGIGEPTPLAPLHVRTAGISLGAGAMSSHLDILVEDTDALLGLYSNSGGVGGSSVVLGQVGSTGSFVDKWVIHKRTGGELRFLYNDTDAATHDADTDWIVRMVPNGRLICRILEITGADVAEKFPTSEPDQIEPGTVMEIDPHNAGKLRISRGSYNRRVAGVVSGAGDIPVGAILGNLPGSEDAPAIALNGRVWVRCDATMRAIEPGDLLTTADRAGCAMKVEDHARATGATIGKAMSSLARGETGMVLVLVNLQ